jgi:hypothetical protein
MAVIALTSARGAPGVSTTALAMALTWPRPTLLLEADAAGSSSYLAGYLQGAVAHDVGLVDLALAQRDNDILGGIHRSSIALPPDGHTRLIPGLTSPVQARTMSSVWEQIAGVLHSLDQHGTDVFIDAGRLGTIFGPQPLLRSADAVLLVTRSNLPAIAAVRATAPVLRDDLLTSGRGDDVLSLLVVGQGQPYPAKDISDAVGIPTVATIDFDPVGAEVLTYGSKTPRRFQQSPFVRSIAAANSALGVQLRERAARLRTTTLRAPQTTEAPCV